MNLKAYFSQAVTTGAMAITIGGGYLYIEGFRDEIQSLKEEVKKLGELESRWYEQDLTDEKTSVESDRQAAHERGEILGLLRVSGDSIMYKIGVRDGKALCGEEGRKSHDH